MNVLVIGGSRFVGKEIIRQSMEIGHSLTVFNRGLTASKSNAAVILGFLFVLLTVLTPTTRASASVPSIRISSMSLTFVGNDGKVIKELPLVAELRNVPVKNLPVKKPDEWFSDSPGNLRVRTERTASTNSRGTFAIFLRMDYIVYKHYGDLAPVGGEAVLLNVSGQEIWRKNLADLRGIRLRVGDDGTVLVSRLTSITVVGVSGNELYSFPSANRPDLGELSIKGASPNHKFVALESVKTSHLIFVDILNKNNWDMEKGYCTVHEISDQGIAKVRCQKKKLEFFEADIKARQLAIWNIRPRR
ncbi:MAG: hypothetical protein AAB262_01510 [Elusimicrobiota bacterium]